MIGFSNTTHFHYPLDVYFDYSSFLANWDLCKFLISTQDGEVLQNQGYRTKSLSYAVVLADMYDKIYVSPASERDVMFICMRNKLLSLDSVFLKLYCRISNVQIFSKQNLSELVRYYKKFAIVAPKIDETAKERLFNYR